MAFRWPWVSRELYDHVVSQWHAAVDVQEQWQTRYLAHVAQVPTVPVQAVVPMDVVMPEPREVSVVAQVIRDQAQGDPRLGAYLRKRARELRHEGHAPEAVAVLLSSWDTTEDEATGA